MIVRMWHGVTPESKADAYLDYLKATGVKEYRAIEGVRLTMVEIVDLVLQSRCIKCSHEIIHRRLEYIVVVKVNRYHGERIRRLHMRRDNPDHFHTLLRIHCEHNAEDLCSSQVQE